MDETAKGEQGDKGFWHTAPGLITAIAALITALGGILGILVQNGVIGWENDGQQLSATQEPAGAAGGEDGNRPEDAKSAPEQGGTSPVSWDRAEADLVRRDGTSTTVKASTVALACTTGSLQFENGQQISLEKVRTIRFDAIYTDSASADGLVTLLNGQELTDPIYTWNCPVWAQNKLGRVQIELEDIRLVKFNR
ncbi:hypothetical protein [Arthrobacter sp. USHLN218]|uniref:hypothetical protein n=1 Tax=Arthrobacter sp. USHLN218 TaxID=3081232 RepID=UPI003016CB91